MGIYRDAVRSSRSHLVKASGLRWHFPDVAGPDPLGGTAIELLETFLHQMLAPSELATTGSADAVHKKLTDWARQMILQLAPLAITGFRPLVLVGDSSYAVLDLLHCCQSLAQPVTLIARLRLDAALYEPAPPRQPGQNGRPPLKGRRLPALKTLLDLPTVSWIEVSAAWYDGTTRTLELTSQTAVWYRSGKPPVPLRWVLVRDPQGEFTPQALLCTDPSADPTQILEWFVLRWQLEVTFQEVRAHLGVKHQPFIIRVIHHRLQQPGPDVPVPPAAEAAVGVLPVPVVRGQIPPGGAGAQNPEHSVDETAVILGRPACLALAAGEKGFQDFPYPV